MGLQTLIEANKIITDLSNYYQISPAYSEQYNVTSESLKEKLKKELNENVVFNKDEEFEKIQSSILQEGLN